MDAALDTAAPCVHVRRAIVNGELAAPKSRHGRRTIPISLELANRLRELVAGRGAGRPVARVALIQRAGPNSPCGFSSNLDSCHTGGSDLSGRHLRGDPRRRLDHPVHRELPHERRGA
jgi:hypothetical protein